MSYPRNTIDRAMLNVEPDLNTGCWLWAGGMFQHGYGAVTFRGRRRLAHRWFYEELRGPIPAGFSLLHRCDTPACVNPAHLLVGTNAQNTADSIAKGRARPLRGERHPLAKLTPAQVAEIREMAQSRSLTQKEIGRRYGITQSNVSMIARGRTWGAGMTPNAEELLRQIAYLVRNPGDPLAILASVRSVFSDDQQEAA